MTKTDTYRLLQCAYEVHSQLGPGLMESTYEACFSYVLINAGFKVKRQVSLPVNFNGVSIDAGYRVDLLVNDEIIIELKAVKVLSDLDFAQLLTYMKLSNLELGYLINFNVKSLKSGIKRVILSQ